MENSQEYLSAKVAAARLGIGESTFWNKVKIGQLPQPDVKMGLRCTRWSWQNIVAFLERQGGKVAPNG